MWFIETISRMILIKRNQKRFERDQVGGGMHMFWRKVSRQSCMHVFLTTTSFIIDWQLIITSELLFSNESQLQVLFNQSQYSGPGGGYFRNFRVGMCRWDPATLTEAVTEAIRWRRWRLSFPKTGVDLLFQKHWLFHCTSSSWMSYLLSSFFFYWISWSSFKPSSNSAIDWMTRIISVIRVINDVSF